MTVDVDGIVVDDDPVPSYTYNDNMRKLQRQVPHLTSPKTTTNPLRLT